MRAPDPLLLRHPMDLDTKINYDLMAKHPTQANNYSVMPRALMEHGGPVFSFLVILTIPSILLILFNDIGVRS